MQSFKWKRKRDDICKPSKSVFLDDDCRQSNEDEWDASVKKPVLILEDALTKANRLKKEGVILAESCKWWSAIKHWDGAAALNPSDHTIHEMMAQAYMQVGEYIPSISCAERAVSAAPMWSCGLQTLGRALLGVGELHKAIVCFSKALRLNPDDSELRQQDLKWAFELLKTYRHLKVRKELTSKCLSSYPQQDNKIMEAKSEDSFGAQIIDLKDHPEGFSLLDESSSAPSLTSSSVEKGLCLEPKRREFSVTDDVRFITCCSSKKSVKEEQSKNSSANNDVDLSKMVCMRPKLPSR